MATVELSFTPLPAHVRTARLVATAVARRSRVDESLLDEVRLAVGEACSRAVEAHRLHCPTEPVRIKLSDGDGRFEVAVTDTVPSGARDRAPRTTPGGAGSPVGQGDGSADAADPPTADPAGVLPEDEALRAADAVRAGAPVAGAARVGGPRLADAAGSEEEAPDAAEAGAAPSQTAALGAESPGDDAPGAGPANGDPGTAEPPGEAAPESVGSRDTAGQDPAGQDPAAHNPVAQNPQRREARPEDTVPAGSLPADIGLAVIEGLADDVRISATPSGVTIRMSWPLLPR